MTRLAVVTGASSGIGEAYATRLAADGWNLRIVARRLERLTELAERLQRHHGVRVVASRADLSQQEDVEALCNELSGAPVGLLVNNAALAYYMPFAELPATQAAELVELNVRAPVMLTRAVLNGMLERRAGAIINVASLLAFSGQARGAWMPRRAAYAATKAFLVTFTQTLSREVEDRGVRLQVLCPGVVRSEFHTRQGMDVSHMPRMEPEDVVKASLADLADGIVVSIPGLEDPAAIERLADASAELLSVARTTELPARYDSDASTLRP